MLPPGGCYLMFGLFFPRMRSNRRRYVRRSGGHRKEMDLRQTKVLSYYELVLCDRKLLLVSIFPDRRSSMRFQSGVDRGVVSCIC